MNAMLERVSSLMASLVLLVDVRQRRKQRSESDTNLQAAVERYLAAALESTPEAKRAEVGPEIRAAVMEMVDLRLDAGEPEADAVRNALTELGDPSRFADAYQESRRELIGPGWYPMYIRTLKMVPAIVLPLVAVVTLLTLLVDIGIDGKNVDSALQSVLESVSE